MNQNNSPESAQDTPTNRSEVIPDIQNQTQNLEEKVLTSITMNTLDHADDPEWVREQFQKQANAFPQYMKKVGEGLSNRLTQSNWDGRMYALFAEAPELQKVLEEIKEKLAMDVPDATESGSPRHPYLDNFPIPVYGKKPMTLTQYRISRTVQYDIDRLNTMLRSNPGFTPAHKQIIVELRSALESYRWNDLGVVAKEIITRKRTRSYTSRAINKMFQITGVLALGTLTLGAGGLGAVHMYANRKKSMGTELFPALGLAALTIYVANPSFARSLFGSDQLASETFSQLGKTVNTSAFKTAAKTHAIEGESGEQIAQMVRETQGETFDAVKRCEMGIGTDDDISMLTAKTAPSAKPKEQETIRRFWKDARSVAGIATIRTLTNKNAVEIAYDFLRLGMGKFYRKAKDTEATIRASSTDMEQSVPSMGNNILQS